MDEYNEQSDPHREPRKPFAYSVEEAAKIAGLSRSSIYLALGDGRLTARKAGRRTIICPQDLQKFVRDLPLFEGKNSSGGE
ncbi:MAG: helix-turn-helix domain-containing protein [Erythrobacter sp.]|jgi:excisionase family DNA binding protein|uniref:Helix-turn-helix domain-containing protein n=1 Tax=Qipengyuania vulgaris TaxID=291985 RepID=A0A844XR68_9SPHN|nr:helix-turn-helix domain-containing protein [Qipengyuania vulgaris]MCH2497392.1 helix-turn-helix domain-containing protein [Erythrobacter sp.]MXO48120.1 helix-turn-helix domain-containing protein [Qipengyuania vulgaris]|tara:strand:- start:556 stop:798 length:243 start_codon:yes stop_codon:yes gene_type:complete